MMPVDGEFTAAANRIGHAMAAKGEDYETAGADLARYLRSDKPLGPEEREILAQLVTGELRRPRGRPPKSPSNAEVVESSLQVRSNPSKAKKDAIGANVKKLGKSWRTLERHDSMVSERKRVIEEAKKPRG
jgi:hypothetical protein